MKNFRPCDLYLKTLVLLYNKAITYKYFTKITKLKSVSKVIRIVLNVSYVLGISLQ